MSSTNRARLGVLGGTFDPIHIGHLSAATQARDAFELDKVLFVPAGQPWQRRDYSAAEDRYLMTALGVATHPAFAATRMELDRRGPTYTADTLEELNDFYEDTDLMLIVGADAALNIGTWQGLERISKTSEVIAVERPGSDLSTLEPADGWPRIRLCSNPPIDVSATDIRTRVRTGRSIEGLVPEKVAGYIEERGLYLGDPEDSDV